MRTTEGVAVELILACIVEWLRRGRTSAVPLCPADATRPLHVACGSASCEPERVKGDFAVPSSMVRDMYQQACHPNQGSMEHLRGVVQFSVVGRQRDSLDDRSRTSTVAIGQKVSLVPRNALIIVVPHVLHKCKRHGSALKERNRRLGSSPSTSLLVVDCLMTDPHPIWEFHNRVVRSVDI